MGVNLLSYSAGLNNSESTRSISTINRCFYPREPIVAEAVLAFCIVMVLIAVVQKDDKMKSVNLKFERILGKHNYSALFWFLTWYEVKRVHIVYDEYMG